MDSGAVVREARLRAGLSQTDLARRAGTTQSSIARLEGGASAPSFERVRELVAACGLELGIWVAEAVPDLPAGDPALPAGLLAALRSGDVAFVLLGVAAAGLRTGRRLEAPEPPAICPADDRANLVALCGVLAAIAARLRTPDGLGTLPFDRTPAELLSRDVTPLSTTEGDLDVMLRPAGTGGYRDLVRGASTIAVQGMDVPVVALADLVRHLEAAGIDRTVVHALRRLVER